MDQDGLVACKRRDRFNNTLKLNNSLELIRYCKRRDRFNNTLKQEDSDTFIEVG